MLLDWLQSQRKIIIFKQDNKTLVYPSWASTPTIQVKPSAASDSFWLRKGRYYIFFLRYTPGGPALD
jgi:hypothetical protein